MRRIAISVALLALISGCSSQPGNTVDVDFNLNESDLIGNNQELLPIPPKPKQSYDFREGDIYGYIGAVSEEDQKKGTAVGPVVMFRYLGFYDAADHLEHVDATGSVIGNVECARPCVAIKTNYGGRLGRTAFSSDSIIGSAIEDAKNGLLDPVSRQKKRNAEPQDETSSDGEAVEETPANAPPIPEDQSDISQ